MSEGVTETAKGSFKYGFHNFFHKVLYDCEKIKYNNLHGKITTHQESVHSMANNANWFSVGFCHSFLD